MRIESGQVLDLAAQVEDHIRQAASLAFFFPDQEDAYKDISRFPDYSLAGLRRNEERAGKIARQVALVRDAGGLSSYDQLALDVLDHFLSYGSYVIDTPTTEQLYFLKFDVTPYSFPLTLMWNTLCSLPCGTQRQVEQHMALFSDYPRFTAQILEKLTEQAGRGIYLSAFAIDGAVSTLRAYAPEPKAHPAGMGRAGSAATQAQLERENAYFEQGRQNLMAAAALLDAAEYREKAPRSVGLSHYEDGAAFYQYLCRFHLNEDASPDYLHALGKKCLEEVYQRQAETRARLGLTGSHQAFMASLKGNPRFYPSSPEELGLLMSNCLSKVNAALPDYFSRLPKTPCRAARLARELEGSLTFGYFEIATPERPTGTYYFNASGLEDKCQISAASIMAHELLPGHHLQIALAQESETLHPLFRKNTGTCYCEGWAEYAAVFTGEQGLYEDAYDEYGRLEMEKFICARLVADTGLNALGWSLEKGVDFMLEHTFCTEAMARSEVIRYGADLPGQCLAYKYGSVKFLELRDLYRAAKGGDYRPKDFHTLVLEAGVVPMDALRRYVQRELGQ